MKPVKAWAIKTPRGRILAMDAKLNIAWAHADVNYIIELGYSPYSYDEMVKYLKSKSYRAVRVTVREEIENA